MLQTNFIIPISPNHTILIQGFTFHSYLMKESKPIEFFITKYFRVKSYRPIDYFLQKNSNQEKENKRKEKEKTFPFDLYTAWLPFLGNLFIRNKSRLITQI